MKASTSRAGISSLLLLFVVRVNLECLDFNKACSGAIPCCYGTCFDGYCGITDYEDCKPYNGGCVIDDDCCWGACVGGVCGVLDGSESQECSGYNGRCVTDDDCCYDICEDGTCIIT